MSIPHLDVLRYNPSDSHISSAPLSDSSDAPAHMLFDSNEVSDHSGTKISSLLFQNDWSGFLLSNETPLSVLR